MADPSPATFRIWKNCDAILEQARTSRRILVAAGPGMGKTTLLQMIEQRLKDPYGGAAEALGLDPAKVATVRCSRGTDLATDDRLLPLLEGLTADRAILIDDIDVAYSAEAERMAWHAHRHSGLVVLTARTFEGLRPPPDPAQRERLRFSGSVASSLNLQNFHRIRLAPPTTDEILAALRLAAPAAAPDLVRALAKETSPHPVVLDAIARVLLANPASLPEARQRLEADLWSRDGRRFAVALEWAQLRDPDATAALGSLFHPADGAPPRAPALEALAEVGLAYRPNGRTWRAATPVLEQLLGTAKLELVPDVARPEGAGVVHYVDAGGTVDVPLTGVLWEVMRAIEAAEGHIADDAIQARLATTRAPTDEPVAVQPARSRLLAKLSEWGLGGLVRYERLTGSRIDLVHARASTRRLRG